MTFDSNQFRQVLGQYPTGVCIIAALGTDGKPVGMTVGSFSSVSLDPPLVGFMPAKSSTTWPKLRDSPTFCVNVLSVDQVEVCRTFASKAADKFQEVPWRPASSGSPVIEGVAAYIDCDLAEVLDAGDHEIVIGRVRELEFAASAMPLLFFRGGYGGFATSAMTASDVDLFDHLRIADAARSEMDALASRFDCQVVASSVVGEAVVLLASAGEFADGTSWSTVGQRFPLVPPMGAPLMAWQPPPTVEAWLARVKTDDERRVWRERIREDRDRGYSVMVESTHLAWFTEQINRRELSAMISALTAEQRRALAELPVKHGDSTAAPAGSIRRIFVPVTTSDGALAVAIGLRLARPMAGPEQLESCVTALKEAALRVAITLDPADL
ncbi:flavin reductase family protein [Nocardioides endophyticus]